MLEESERDLVHGSGSCCVSLHTCSVHCGLVLSAVNAIVSHADDHASSCVTLCV